MLRKLQFYILTAGSYFTEDVAVTKSEPMAPNFHFQGTIFMIWLTFLKCFTYYT